MTAAPSGARAPGDAVTGAVIPGVAVTDVAASSGLGRVRMALDTSLRVAGGLVAVVLAAITAVVEIAYVPLRVGGVPIGVSVVAAVLINYWLLRYAVAVTGAGWAGLLPPVAWFGLMLVAAEPATEGDILLSTGNWAGLATIFLGSLAFAVAGYRLMLRPSASTVV